MVKTRRTTGDQSPRPPMDYLTAAAFASEAFKRLHPVLPKDFWRHAMRGTFETDADRNYIIGFVWQRKTSKTGAETFFQVLVNAWNAKTTVLLDIPLGDFRPEDFEVYE
jgi:hypothetical protein